ncbi:MAG: hypothetical protein HRT36_04080 [Alphaproteobacteria bacterium]|nr:hypothetical protein [Alphaproteobacteria bacterium]
MSCALTNVKIRKIDLEQLAEDVRQYPDADQYERTARFVVTYKKTLKHSKCGRQQTACLSGESRPVRMKASPLILIRAVFKNSFAHDMPQALPPRGRDGTANAIGLRAKGTGITGALTDSALLTACMFQCNIDSARALVHNKPCPEAAARLRFGDGQFHKRDETNRTINDANHTLEFLPSSSPAQRTQTGAGKILKTNCSVEELLTK